MPSVADHIVVCLRVGRVADIYKVKVHARRQRDYSGCSPPRSSGTEVLAAGRAGTSVAFGTTTHEVNYIGPLRTMGGPEIKAILEFGRSAWRGRRHRRSRAVIQAIPVAR